ncbi:MAG TPA: FxLYD domain-containing protein [Vicinamibacterales bacterium]|nr:FxLYD domain-containing protein [Vicinamibacterales bacterium]
MDIVLLVITIVSLVAAFLMSAAAWRMSREERARSAARIAALAAAADADDAVGPARVLRPAAPAAPVAPPWAPARGSAPLGDAFLGSSLRKPSNGGQRGLAIAAGILFLTIVVGGYFTVFNGDSPAASAAAPVRAGTPLELIALRHERQPMGLAITGLVRNPVSGAAVEKLGAVVLLFDQQGAFVTSSRADVDFTTLAPGDESPFVITLDAPSNVARYRVSFRNDAGVVPHIDRRGQEPIARDTP